MPRSDAAAIDSQPVKRTENGGLAGSFAGKKIKGRKCNIAVDVDGPSTMIKVHTADAQDRKLSCAERSGSVPVNPNRRGVRHAQANRAGRNVVASDAAAKQDHS